MCPGLLPARKEAWLRPGTFCRRENSFTEEILTTAEMAPLTKKTVIQGLLLATLVVLLAGCVPVNLPAPTVIQSPVSTVGPQKTDSQTLDASHASNSVLARRLLYYSNAGSDRSHIYVMDSDGANAKKLTDSSGDDIEGAWSPDGSKIAFSSDRAGNFDIFVMDSDGQNVQRLTQDPGLDWSPAWSPDGKQIAFSSNRDGEMRLFVMNADGSDQRPLLTGPNGAGWAPVWSPIHREMAFVSERDGSSEIYLLELDSGNITRLTNNDRPDDRPVWSPDGNQILYAGAKENTSVFDADELYIIPRSGGEPRQLTDNLDGDVTPSWSPDGTWIAFSSNRKGEWDIYIMPAAGGEVKRLTQGGARNRGPRWEP
jgi:Tol biopolymer transport system component